MGTMTHAAARLAFSKAIDVVLKDVDKNREEAIVKIVDLMQKYMGDEKLDLDYDNIRKMIRDKDGAFNKYINKVLDEIDPHVLKTAALNLGYEAFFHRTTVTFRGRSFWILPVPVTCTAQDAGQQSMATS